MKFNLKGNNKYKIAAILRKLIYTETVNILPYRVTVYKNTTPFSNEELVHRMSLIYFTQPGTYNIQVKNKKIITTLDYVSPITTNVVYDTTLLICQTPFDLHLSCNVAASTYKKSSNYSSITAYKYTKIEKEILTVEYRDCIVENEKNNLEKITNILKQNLKAEIAKWTKA